MKTYGLFCPADGDPCRRNCNDTVCKRTRGIPGKIPLVTTHTPTADPTGSETTIGAKKPTPRFTPEEIDDFLTFLLEGGADKRCSNVYLIITQLRDDLALCQQSAVPPQPDFESWWEVEKTRPPYTNPKAIAKSAWDAARKSLMKDFRQIFKPKEG